MGITGLICSRGSWITTIMCVLQKTEHCDLQRRLPSPSNRRYYGLIGRGVHILNLRGQYCSLANWNLRQGQGQDIVCLARWTATIFWNAVRSEERRAHSPRLEGHNTVSGHVKHCTHIHGRCIHHLKVCRRESGPTMDSAKTAVDRCQIIETEKWFFLADLIDYLGCMIQPGRLGISTKATDVIHVLQHPTYVAELRFFWVSATHFDSLYQTFHKYQHCTTANRKRTSISTWDDWTRLKSKYSRNTTFACCYPQHWHYQDLRNALHFMLMHMTS